MSETETKKDLGNGKADAEDVKGTKRAAEVSRTLLFIDVQWFPPGAGVRHVHTVYRIALPGVSKALISRCCCYPVCWTDFFRAYVILAFSRAGNIPPFLLDGEWVGDCLASMNNAGVHKPGGWDGFMVNIGLFRLQCRCVFVR